MADKIYTLKLTGDEVWAIHQAFEASILDTDSMNAAEKSGKKKLDRALMQRHADKQRG